MVTNDFLGFCNTDTGTNLIEQSAWPTDPGITIGMQPGIASSARTNKALRQSTYVAAQVAQLVANLTQTNVLDNATPAQLLAQLYAAIKPYAPIVTTLLSGSGNFNLTYIFQIATGSATVGATYTNNGVTYTVTKTVSAGVELFASGSGAPLTSGTLTNASGTGDATIAFYAVRAPIDMEYEMVGAGGGGGGGGVGATAGTGTTGGDTTFGPSTAHGGVGGDGIGNGGAGGTAVVGSGASGLPISGSIGGGASVSGSAGVYVAGGNGGASPFGGQGAGGGPGANGQAAQVNSGSGGGGANNNGTANGYSGGGGASGGFVKGQISNPTGAYAYSVGSHGTGGSAGASGLQGAAGGDGAIIIRLRYQ